MRPRCFYSQLLNSCRQFCELSHQFRLRNHDTLLEHFGSICKVSDVAKAEDRYDFLARKHRVDVICPRHILSDNLGACLSKT